MLVIQSYAQRIHKIATPQNRQKQQDRQFKYTVIFYLFIVMKMLSILAMHDVCTETYVNNLSISYSI